MEQINTSYYASETQSIVKQIDRINPKQIDGEYSVLFTSRPFGINFSNEFKKNKLSKTDVFVKSVNPESARYDDIILGSKLVKIQNEIVEGKNPKQIMKLFQTKYCNELPLKMTFRKPEVANSMNFPLDCSHSRTVFFDINEFYKHWRSLPSAILIDVALIVTDIDYEWILKPTEYDGEYKAILNDSVFTNLLQWKYEQGLIFTLNPKMDKVRKNKVSSFWYRISNEFMALSDPLTYNTTNYMPFKLDLKYYRNLSKFENNVTFKDIKNTLCALTMNIDAIKEILYHSNVSLNIYDEKNEQGLNAPITNRQKSASRSVYSHITDDSEIDEMLDEISSVWEQGKDDNITYIE